jgi:hypothetical protein
LSTLQFSAFASLSLPDRCTSNVSRSLLFGGNGCSATLPLVWQVLVATLQLQPGALKLILVLAGGKSVTLIEPLKSPGPLFHTAMRYRLHQVSPPLSAQSED